MKNLKYMLFLIVMSGAKCNELPSFYDLRLTGDINQQKKQAWGTCWAFSAIASIESNILKNNKWSYPSIIPFGLSEYHMDKFSGFTRKSLPGDVVNDWNSGQPLGYPGSNSDNRDLGLMVHFGGDFKIATAYLMNNLGAVEQWKTPAISHFHQDFDKFGNLDDEGIKRTNDYDYYLPKKVIWLNEESEYLQRRLIKETIIKHGAVSSAQYMEKEPFAFLVPPYEYQFYFGKEKENHAVNIIGWDDDVGFPPLQKGAWIIRDSAHEDSVGMNIGNFYVSYYDKYVGQNSKMGVVSFQEVEQVKSLKRYSHSLHGWSHDLENVDAVKNVFKTRKNERIHGVSFYNIKKNDHIKIELYDDKDKNICTKDFGEIANVGFYFFELEECHHKFSSSRVELVLKSSSRSYALDASKRHQILLGEQSYPLIVGSKSNRGESYYFKNNKWLDIYDLEKSFEGISILHTSNFPIDLLVLKDE